MLAFKPFGQSGGCETDLKRHTIFSKADLTDLMLPGHYKQISLLVIDLMPPMKPSEMAHL